MEAIQLVGRDEFKQFLAETYAPATAGMVWVCGFHLYLPDLLEKGAPEEFEAAFEMWLKLES